ncbi:MAG: VWA domain-containing protein [Deltaproteobacteria bacterium]|nr:VWA domain-containing protein [Deltaproteobacteria bacterium]
MLQFAQPLWLIAGIFTCLAAALFIRINIVRRKKELQQFASAHLLAGLTRNVSIPRRQMKNILLVLGLVCLFVALARPQYGNRWVEVKRKGIDILIGIDVSKSMLARDISPNRLERAKLAIRDFVARLEGDRIGLLPFAGTSFLMCPLTTDYDAFNASLDALDVNTIPKGGTDIGAAIREADNILTNEANHKIFVLVTDGEDLSEDGLKAAEEAKAQKMTVYTIGVGTPKGELVPQPGDASGKFIKDREGNFITSRLDEKILTKIAEATGGLYVPLGNMGQGFDTIYQQKLVMVPKEVHGERKRKVPIERFPWPLGTAILLLSADFLITGRKSRWALRLPFVKTAGRRKQQAAVLTLLLLSMAWSPSGQASQGEELFKNGNYEQSIQFYQEQLKNDPDDPTLHYNLGDALYRNKKYKEAVSAFNNGLKTEDLSLQARSYYNRGNTQFFLGAGTEKTDPEHTIKLWQQALKSYQAALALQPEDEEAAHNRNVVEKKLEQLKKQEQENQQKDKDQKKNKEKKGNKENKGDKSQQQDEQKQSQNSNRQKQQQEKGDKGKKQPEKQGDENNRKSAGDKEQKDQQQEQNKDTAGNAAEQQQSNKNTTSQQGREMSKQDMARKLEGKMTREEAKNLLESLKGEQRELNFIPQRSGSPDNEGRDW